MVKQPPKRRRSRQSVQCVQKVLPVFMFSVGVFLCIFFWYVPAVSTGHAVMGVGQKANPELSLTSILGSLLFVAFLAMAALTFGYRCRQKTN